MEVDFEVVFSEHMLLAILHFVHARDLLSSACLVNKRWRDAISAQALWWARLPPLLRGACAGASRYSGDRGPCRLFHALHSSNLLLNPSLQLSEQLPNRISSRSDAPGRGRTPWFSMDSWRWEGSAPKGLREAAEGGELLPPPPLPQYNPEGPGGARRVPTGVLTSSNTWSAILQIVELPRELQRRGIPEAVAAAFLDSCPPLELSIWHCGPAHGRARCEVWLALADDALDASSWLQATDLASGRHAAVVTTGLRPCSPARWSRVRLRLQGYTPGCRRAFVVLKGEGQSCLAEENVGVWGAKFAAPELRLLPAEELLAPG